jgi:ribonuclease P protein component
MAKQYTLNASQKIKSRKIIEGLFAEGKKLTATPYKVYYSLTANTAGLKFGIGVSAKSFKKAVDRNKIKRLTREAYRLQKNSLEQKVNAKAIQLDLFFIYTARELPVYNSVYEAMGKIIRKLEALVL